MFFFVKYKTSVLSNNRFAKETSFSKATMVMQFPAKKNASYPKAPHDFPPRKNGILYPPLGCLGTPLPLPQSLCGRTDGRTDGHVTITSQPKFLGSIGYQICLAMELRWRAKPAGSATNLIVNNDLKNTHTCIRISSFNRNNVITHACSFLDSSIERTCFENWFVVIYISQCYADKDKRRSLIGYQRGPIKSLYFQMVDWCCFSVQWCVNVYLTRRRIGTESSVIISFRNLVSVGETHYGY